MNVPLRMLIATVLLVLTVGTGIGTSNRGKPYPDILYIFHKLLSVSLTVYTSFFIIGLLRMETVEFTLVLLLVVGGTSIVALFVSGALMNTGRIPHERANAIHFIASILMIVTIGIFLIMMIWRTAGKPAWSSLSAPQSPLFSVEQTLEPLTCS